MVLIWNFIKKNLIQFLLGLICMFLYFDNKVEQQDSYIKRLKETNIKLNEDKKNYIIAIGYRNDEIERLGNVNKKLLMESQNKDSLLLSLKGKYNSKKTERINQLINATDEEKSNIIISYFNKSE